MAKKVVLAGACRTAIGKMGGGLSKTPASSRQRLPPCYNLLVSNAPAAAKLAGAFLFYLRL